MSLRGGGPSLSSIFSTHPSLERRLRELDKVQQQLNRAS
jgi:Zn-dependent protease with chaperone function